MSNMYSLYGWIYQLTRQVSRIQKSENDGLKEVYGVHVIWRLARMIDNTVVVANLVKFKVV